MPSTRAQRQVLVRQIVRDGAISTQNELVEELRSHGCEVTQATVSRDIAELDLKKDGQGTYALPEDLRLQAATAAAARSAQRALNQVVVLTEPGSAPSIAAAIDAAGRPGVLGSIAGDDTILVIANDEEAAERFQKDIEEMIA